MHGARYAEEIQISKRYPNMHNESKFYIDGEWTDPIGKKILEVINPATERPIATIALGCGEDVNRAVAAARRAFEPFSHTSKEARLELLGRIIDVYKSRMDEIAGTLSGRWGRRFVSPGMPRRFRVSDISARPGPSSKASVSWRTSEPLASCGSRSASAV
jgi:hypothetical protein